MADDYATKTDVSQSEMRLLERMEQIETNLLTAFHKWASPVEIRLRTTEAQYAGITERMAALETRVREIEQRRQ